MRRFSFLILFIVLICIYGCEKDNLTNATDIYTPYLHSKRDNGTVFLNWGKPLCELTNSCPKQDPLYFEILVSLVGASDFKVYSTTNNNTFNATVNKLTNGVPHYFAIKAIGSKGAYTISNIVMTIPSPKEDLQPVFQTIDNDSELGTWSNNASMVSYMGNYSWNDGNSSAKAVFMFNLLTNENLLVEKSSYSPEWSPSEQKIVYHTDDSLTNTSQGYRPSHIAVYDLQTKTINRITDGNSFNYRPTWSPDGKWIAFLSDRAASKEFNIWKIPANGGTAIKITSDFNDLSELGIIDDRSPHKPTWSKDGNSIVFARKNKYESKYVFDIFSVPSTGGNKTTIISSQWNDYCPTYSPDGSTIAFVSNRSGLDEIWAINLQTKKLSQITGTNNQEINANWGKIEWSPLGDKILFTGYSNGFSTLYTVNIN